MEFSPETFPPIVHYKFPILLGFIITTLLFGSSLFAFVNYLQFSYATDRRGTRIMVWSVASIAVLDVIFSLAYNMRAFAFRFGLKPVRDDAKWDSMHYVIGGITHALVAGYFARRAWLMYKRPVFLAVILTLLISATAVGAAGAAAAHIIAPLGTRTQLDAIFTYILLIGQMVGDITISILIVVKLLGSRTGWRTTDSIIHQLMIIGIQTQSPPSFCAIAFLITYAAAPYPTYILAFVFFGQIYVLCFFAALNSRYTIAAFIRSESSHPRKDDSTGKRRSLPPSINVTTETYNQASTIEVIDNEASWMKPAVTETKRQQQGRLDDSTDSLQLDGQDADEVRVCNASKTRLV